MAIKKASTPPTRHHYVRVHGPLGVRVYVTNQALRSISPTMLDERVRTSLSKSPKTGITLHKHPKFTVQVNADQREAHVQLTSER